MKITKQRLKEIIREELNLGDLQSDEKFTGGTPEERLLTLMKARELLAAMSKEELTQLSLSLDGETTRALQHLLANPMLAPTGDQEHETELEEYRGEPERKKPAPRPSSDTRSSNSGYRSGATGKRNQGRGGY